jgi:hypothetical protein
MDNGFVGALTSLEPTDVIPIVGVVGATALTTMVVVRGVCSPSASLLFTNVRLLPCYAEAAVHHMHGSGTGTSLRDTATREVHRVRRMGEDSIDRIAEGFGQAVEGGRRKADGLTDPRLLVQIGIVLGLVYTAFLTLWFWATRVRWNPRGMA